MGKDARMHIRLDADLKDFAEDYARRHHTTHSALIIRFFVNLREQERRLLEAEDVESI